MNEARTGTTDVLTRTTFQIDGEISTTVSAHLRDVLQRVPGVLLAEIDAAGCRVIVGHDAAVPSKSLETAFTGAGVRANIVADTRATATRIDKALPSINFSSRRLLIVLVALIFLPAFIGSISPSLAKNHFLLPIVLICVWAFFIARATFGRRT